METPQDRIDRVCNYRGVPTIKTGQPCTVNDKKGMIVDGNSSCNFDVRLACNRHVSNCHPFWKMIILSMDRKVVIFDSEDVN